MLMLPFAYIISGSVVALVTLRKGPAIGLQTLIVSLLVLNLFFAVANLPPQISTAFALVIWLPVWLAAASLRLSEQQGALICTVGLFVVSLIVAVYITIGDVSVWWQQLLIPMIEEAAPPELLEQYKNILSAGASKVNAAAAIGLMLNIIAAVFCARWWQSRLYNLGGFQKEFYALRLPPVILPIGGIIILLLLVLDGQWLSMLEDITVILMLMYLMQGISSVHRNVDKFKLSTAWLVAMYSLLVLMPLMGRVIACLGIMDVYIEWRRNKNGSQK